MASRFFKFGSVNQSYSFTKAYLNCLGIGGTGLRYVQFMKRCVIVNNIDTIR